jgi:hypothetical protein
LFHAYCFSESKTIDLFLNNSDAPGRMLTFAAGKTQLDTIEVLAERNAVRNKLIRLNEQLEHMIPAAWDIHPHYTPEHIAAHIQTNFHHEENVRALWVAYGRDWNGPQNRL